MYACMYVCKSTCMHAYIVFVALTKLALSPFLPFYQPVDLKMHAFCCCQAELDRARQFYELVNMQVDELLQSIYANGVAFTEEQYRSVRALARTGLKCMHFKFQPVCFCLHSMVIGLICANQIEPDPSVYTSAMEDLHAIFAELV